MRKIDINLKPSRQYDGILLLAFLGALVGLFASQIPLWSRFFFGLLLLFYGLYFSIFVQKTRVTRLRQVSPEEWQITTSSGVVTGVLCGDSTITFLCCLLRLKQPGERRKFSYVIWRDSMDKNHYRRLLVQLKCYKHPD